MVSRLGEAGQNPGVARQRATQGWRYTRGIHDGVDDAGALEPQAQAMRASEIRRSAPIGIETDEKDNRKLADGRAPSCDATGETASHLYRRGKWNPL
jgi:hypothetical protein